MIRPNPLKKGDKVALIAPSSPVEKSRIQKSIYFIEKLGLKVVLGKSINLNHGFFAGTDIIRANDINMMFADHEIKGIFCARGGYGAARLLDLLDYNIIENNPKVFAGYSDITALHSVFNQKCGLITYHSPMISTELYKGVDDYTINSLKKNIFETNNFGLVNNNIEGLEVPTTLVGGHAKGRIVGGNLSVIISSMGTRYELDTKGKILFLEDIGEYLYKIDRMLLQLKQCQKFKDANGIILGAWTNCIKANEKNSLTFDEILKELILPENKPTIYNFQCGHCIPTLTLALGSKTYLDADKCELYNLNE